MEKYFHSNLRYLRKKNGLTLIDLSNIVSISKSALSDYENKLSEPTISSLELLAVHFGLELNDLVYHDLTQGVKIAKDTNQGIQADLTSQILNQRLTALTNQIDLMSQLIRSKDDEITALRMQIKLLNI
jgi:transcriptional regulator with XRE-family HTH domain